MCLTTGGNKNGEALFQRTALIFHGVIEMEFKTIDRWDEELWNKAHIVYKQAFNHGAKPEKIIRNMFDKGICYLHVAIELHEVMAMAITGIVNNGHTLLIDYLAVKEDKRGMGVGHKMLKYIEEWCKSHGWLNSIIIEAESEPTPENKERIHFWEKNGFIKTDYVHQYIWVPEPYLALYKKLSPDADLPIDGEALFQFITGFHRDSFNK
jgi:GNAT superfamily N-acetyltransferase